MSILNAMLIASAVLSFLVGLMHSVLGGKNLIHPTMKLDNLPVILGNISMSRLTLLVGWHALTVPLWGIGALLAYMAADPSALYMPFLWMVSISYGFLGLCALIISKARHLSWVMFIPISVMTGAIASGIIKL